MAKILDKDNNTILVKFTIREFKKIADSWVLDKKDWLNNFEFVFDEPVKAADLLKTF